MPWPLAHPMCPVVPWGWEPGHSWGISPKTWPPGPQEGSWGARDHTFTSVDPSPPTRSLWRGGGPLPPPPFLSAHQGWAPHPTSLHPSLARWVPMLLACCPHIPPPHTPSSSYSVSPQDSGTPPKHSPPLPPCPRHLPEPPGASILLGGKAPRCPPRSRSTGAYLRGLGPAAGAPPGTHPVGSNHAGKPQHRNPGPPWGEAEACPGSWGGGAQHPALPTHTAGREERAAWPAMVGQLRKRQCGAAEGGPCPTGLSTLRRDALLWERERAGAALS